MRAEMLRGLAYTVGVVALLLPLTGLSGAVAGVVGALAGLWVGRRLADSRLRRRVLFGGLLAAGVQLAVADWLLTDWSFASWMFGPVWVLQLDLWLDVGGAALLTAAALRVASTRLDGGPAIEVVAVATAVAVAVAPHRDGAIARPLWLSDFAWTYGFEPSRLLVLLGVSLGMGAFLFLLLQRRRLGVAALGALAIAGFLLLGNAERLLPPPSAGGSALDELQDGYGDVPSSSSANGSDAGGGQPEDAEASTSDAAGEGDGEGTGESSESSEEDDDDSDAPPNPIPVAILLLGDDYDPPSEGYYLRQTPHSQFNGTRLVEATRSDVDTDRFSYFPADEVRVPPPPMAQRKKVEATVALLVDHDAPFALETPVSMVPVPNPRPARFVRAYAFEAQSVQPSIGELLDQEVGDPSWPRSVWDHYTDWSGDPRYEELTHVILAELPEARRDDPVAQAVAVKLWLDARMKYSQRARHADAADPTADFLFGDLIGYCVHSSHAAVFLWRSLGIPARIGTGYMVDAADRRGSALLVRDDHAHSWPEVYLRDLGWVVLDISPSENLDPEPPPVDEAMVDALADMAREEVDTGDRVDAAAWGSTLLAALQTLGWLLGVGLLGGHYVVKLWRRAAPWVSDRSIAVAGYRAALDQLAELGLSRRHGESRERFAQRVGSPSFAALTDLHVAAVFGGHAQPSSRWRAALSALRGELSGRAPWYRRLLGLLDPSSIHRSR